MCLLKVAKLMLISRLDFQKDRILAAPFGPLRFTLQLNLTLLDGFVALQKDSDLFRLSAGISSTLKPRQVALGKTSGVKTLAKPTCRTCSAVATRDKPKVLFVYKT